MNNTKNNNLIRIYLNKNEFNKLIELLEENEKNPDGEIAQKSSRLKEKLMTYSFAFKKKEGYEETASLVLYPIEIAEIMKQLLLEKNKNEEIDYFDELKSQKTKEEKTGDNGN